MARNKTQSRCGGYSLVELMIAIGILGVGLAMVSTTLPAGILNNAQSNQYANTTAILDNAMPTIRMTVSHEEMKTYLAGARAQDAAITSGAMIHLTYPVYSWPSPTPLTTAGVRINLFYGLPLSSFVYPNPAESLISPPVPQPVPPYLQLPLNSRWYKPSDWGTFTDSGVTDAVPTGRDGWMLAVCPTAIGANDYYFIIFPYRKILPNDVCHVNFKFIRLFVTNGIVTQFWDETSRTVLAINQLTGGLVNSPLVNMTDPTIRVQTLENGTGGIMYVARPGWTTAGNPTYDGWWLGVQSIASRDTVSPAVGCYVFRDRLKD